MQRLGSFGVLSVLYVLSVLSVARAEVSTWSRSPLIQFAAGEIAQALKERSEDIRVFLGTFDSFPGGAAKKPPAVAEAFAITRTGETIVLAGDDETAVHNGGLTTVRAKALLALLAALGKETRTCLKGP